MITQEEFESYILSVKPRLEGISPSIVNNVRFHTLLKDYLIKLDDEFTSNPYVQNHQKTCECEPVPKNVVNFLAYKTKEILDKYNVKFGYAAFVHTDNINKQQVKTHLHIQSVMEPLKLNKEIAIFVSFAGEYEFEYFPTTVNHSTVLNHQLFLRNEEDKVADFVNPMERKTIRVKGGDAVLFDGQNLIHGGKIISGCGMWVILSLCSCDPEIIPGSSVLL